jgi:hypothetical protein
VVLIHLADNSLAEMTLLGEHGVIAFAYCQLSSPWFLATIFYIQENFMNLAFISLVFLRH